MKGGFRGFSRGLRASGPKKEFLGRQTCPTKFPTCPNETAGTWMFAIVENLQVGIVPQAAIMVIQEDKDVGFATGND